MKIKICSICAASAVAAMVLAGCGEEKKPAAAGAIPSLVSIQKLAAADELAYFEYPATIASAQDVMLLSKASGEVVKIYVKDGQRVQKDQLLVQIDNEMALAQLQAANADLAAANAEFYKAEHELKRTLALKASTSAKQMDAVKAAHKRAQAAVLKAQAALKIAEINESHTRILAPFSGVLGKVLVNEGEFVAASSSKIVRISNTQVFKAEFFIPDSDRQKLLAMSNNQPASFVYAGKRYGGHVAFVDSNNELAAAKSYAEFSEGNVPLESFVKLRIEDLEQKNVYKIKKENLLQDVNGYYIYLRRAGKAEQLHVKVVFENEEFALVRAAGSGINDGDELILNNYKKIHPGSAVATDAEFAAMMKAAAAAKSGGAAGAGAAGAGAGGAGANSSASGAKTQASGEAQNSAAKEAK